jgi:hypothetical protein
MYRMRIAILLCLAACGGSDGGPPPPDPDAPSSSCAGITGNYNASGSAQVGSTCDPSTSVLSAAATVSGDATNGFTLALEVGGITYECNGVVNGCRLDATCTGTAGDGSSARGMLTVTFSDTGFIGTMTEDFTGTTNCHNAFDLQATRS